MVNSWHWHSDKRGKSTSEHTSYLLQSLAGRVKNPSAMQETWIQSLGQEELLEKWRATHFNILAEIIPQTEELEPMGSESNKRKKKKEEEEEEGEGSMLNGMQNIHPSSWYISPPLPSRIQILLKFLSGNNKVLRRKEEEYFCILEQLKISQI